MLIYIYICVYRYIQYNRKYVETWKIMKGDERKWNRSETKIKSRKLMNRQWKELKREMKGHEREMKGNKTAKEGKWKETKERWKGNKGGNVSWKVWKRKKRKGSEREMKGTCKEMNGKWRRNERDLKWKERDMNGNARGIQGKRKEMKSERKTTLYLHFLAPSSVPDLSWVCIQFLGLKCDGPGAGTCRKGTRDRWAFGIIYIYIVYNTR